MESLENENKQLHSKVINLKQLDSEMKKQKNFHLQNLSVDSPVLQTEISNIKNLQEEIKSQQAELELKTLGLMWSRKGNVPHSRW
jgi:DNA repair exonuclease SbcCD ATPase subunit